MRRTRRGMPPARAGLIAVLVLVPLVYLAFAKALPFDHGYRIHAVFRSALNIAPSSPVRIAGVEVGHVTGVARRGDADAAVVTMEIDDAGRPVHRDATLKLRPRLFLEGNFFVDLHPGTPAAPDLPDGGTIPLSQTANPVQVDQVLSTLDQPTRTGLQVTLDAYGGALTRRPTPQSNATQDPLVHDMTAARALNDAAGRGGPALKGISLVNQAMLGLEPRRDVPGLIRAVGSATEQLGRSERSLQDFVTALDTTAGAFAAQSGDLARSVALLPVALGRTRAAFAGLTDTLPAVRTFANGFTDVARQLPAVYRYAPAWIVATEGLLAPRRFGGVARDLRLLAAPLAGLVPAQTALARRIDASAACGARVVLPTLATRLDDGPLSTGQPNYEELLRAFTGLAGTAQNFDGNGDFLHVLAGSGNTIVKAGPGGQPGAKSFGGWAIEPPTGTSPRFPGVERRTSYDMQFPRVPPIRTDVPCATQARPDVNGPLSTGPADRSAPRSP